MSRTGARRGNLNAGRHGLYSLRPYIRVKVAHTITVAELSGLAMTLADGALWISEALAGMLIPPEGERREQPEIIQSPAIEVTALTFAPALGDGASATEAAEASRLEMAALAGVGRVISLYALVAHELYQVAGELAGVTGIKAASLGQLSNEEFDAMMRAQAQALGLILSQCRSAWQAIQDHERIEGNGLMRKGELNPILESLAGHMRSAKRMLREFAANRAWRQADEEQTGNLADRIRAVIPVRE